ncbi:hypothetical protein AB0J52_35210, partial [Spirillospora sp. NPDC049652]
AAFPEGPRRTRALGVNGALLSLGFVIGTIGGGLITSGLNWRWTMLILFGIGALVVTGAVTVVPETAGRSRARLDVPGAILASGGLFALVYGISDGGRAGWGSVRTVATLLGAAVLLGAFLAAEARHAAPLGSGWRAPGFRPSRSSGKAGGAVLRIATFPGTTVERFDDASRQTFDQTTNHTPYLYLRTEGPLLPGSNMNRSGKSSAAATRCQRVASSRLPAFSISAAVGLRTSPYPTAAPPPTRASTPNTSSSAIPASGRRRPAADAGTSSDADAGTISDAGAASNVGAGVGSGGGPSWSSGFADDPSDGGFSATKADLTEPAPHTARFMD